MGGSIERVPTFCALCVSHCGAEAVVEDGRFTALVPDPLHPTGQALCVKGRAAPEIVDHPDRLLYPLRRTRAKGDSDPGWERIGWDAALATVADRMNALARDHGPESVVFASASPSTSALSDSIDWIQRLRRAFGSPNFCVSMELCGWGRYLATTYTFGWPVPGVYLPDLERAGCILYWGYNPSVARLVHATATAAALKRGARLVVVDPRRAGLARKADVWLRVRPGTDGALALAISHVLLERGWFDRAFVVRWTNATYLVRDTDGRLLRESDVAPDGDSEKFVVWDQRVHEPVGCAPRHGPPATVALTGERKVMTNDGPVSCRTVFDHILALCRAYAPREAESITGVRASDIESAARLLWEARPVAYYAWSGVEQHTNATATARAIAQLYVLIGSLDGPGGNVRFPSAPTNPIDGADLLSAAQRSRSLGLARHPLGPSRWEFVTSDDVYTGALEGRPYPVRGLVNFGSNLLLSQPDGLRGRRALAALDFYVHADLFMNPTAELADVVLPVASPFETEALQVGFEVNPTAASHVQLRRPVVAARGEARSDLEIVFALATHLGLGGSFWDGSVEAGFRHRLAPSGVTLESLRTERRGVRVPLEVRHRKFAEPTPHGAVGFPTPSGAIELYSEALLSYGAALPNFEEPRVSPKSRPDLRDRFPLILTSAKSTWFCESQHRNIASLRRLATDPEIELHPDAGRARGIAEGAWVRIETPHGSVRARARWNESLDPGVACGQHGFWQACDEIGAAPYAPFSPRGANLNLLFPHDPSDPISGSVPLRASMCEIRPEPLTR